MVPILIKVTLPLTENLEEKQGLKRRKGKDWSLLVGWVLEEEQYDWWVRSIFELRIYPGGPPPVTVVQIGGAGEFAEVSKVPHPWIYIQMPRCVAMNSYPMRLLILPPLVKLMTWGMAKFHSNINTCNPYKTDMSCSNKSSSFKTLYLALEYRGNETNAYIRAYLIVSERIHWYFGKEFG